MTGVNLQTISDIYVHPFLEKGMRGAISYIMIVMKKVNISCTGMQIIYMDVE